VGFLGGFSLVRVVSPLSLETSSSCQCVILTSLPAADLLRPSG
jgi:hypothetical protein